MATATCSNASSSRSSAAASRSTAKATVSWRRTRRRSDSRRTSASRGRTEGNSSASAPAASSTSPPPTTSWTFRPESGSGPSGARASTRSCAIPGSSSTPRGRSYGQVLEDSVALGLIRRFASNLVPQSYDLIVGGTKVADLRQNFNPFTYHLRIEFGVPPAAFDRRLGLAAAVLLGVIEGRQGREG